MEKKEGLALVLSLITNILRGQPQWFVGEFELSVLAGLRNIARETAMDAEGIALFDRLAIRRNAAALAYEIYTLYDDQKVAIPDVIMEWRAICNSEIEFAEIRNQWVVQS